MRGSARIIFVPLFLLLTAHPLSARCLEGEVVRVTKDLVTFSFPMPVKRHSVILIMRDGGESVAGSAVAERCGGVGPYDVIGKLMFVANPYSVVVGQKACVDTLNVSGLPSSVEPAKLAAAPGSAPMPAVKRRKSRDEDLNFYYFAGGQKVGYGAFGVGYEKTLRLAKGVGIQLDGGISAIGNVTTADKDRVDADQLIETLNGRLKMDWGKRLGAYAGYRWSRARGDEKQWNELVRGLQHKSFLHDSKLSEGEVMMQGVEYGVTFRTAGRIALSLGYIPQCRTDYGGFGVLSEPGATAELRFGIGAGVLRLRAITTDDYWSADLGVTVR
jgi:hypothetical protein